MANLKSVLKCWTEFNLPALQKTLDQTATETVSRQDEAEKAKRNLIDLTKEWRKNTEEDVRTKCAPVIKAFQKEIDSLNKRSKVAENSFLHLYKNLLEIPDPVPSLKQVEVIKKQLDKTKDLEIENQKLHDTLAEYNTEFAEVKNQEVTLQKLKEKLKTYEEQGEGKLKTLLEEKESLLQAEYAEREQVHLDSKLQIATKLGEAESKAKSLTKDLVNAQVEIFELKTKHEEELTARLSEIEILETDLERANQNLLAGEKLIETLQLQSESVQLQSEDAIADNYMTEKNNDTIRTLEYQLLSKENEMSQLIEELHNLQGVSSKARVSAENEIAELESQLAEKCELLQSLQAQVGEQSDYDEIKREISIMKMIEFSGLQQEGDDTTSPAKSLEKLLLEKNKNLQSECTSLKVHNVEVTSKYDELQKKHNDSSRLVQEQGELIKQLEADLLNVRGVLPSVYRGEGVGAPSPPPDSPDSEAILKAVQDINTDEVDELEKHNSDSLLPIISSQRERFRNRNLELESQNAHQQRQITLLQNEVDSVRHDNVKLYEKIKFLQSYPTQGATNVQMEDDSVKRYSSQYEERIDPFAVFSQREKQQRYSNLTAPEKVTLNMGRFILSNKIARTLVFFYTLLLHCLVFIVLYKFAFIEPCKRVMTAAAPDHQWFVNQLPTHVSRLGKSSRTS